MTLRSLLELTIIDLSDVLRPPGLDILLVIVATLGSLIVSIVPITDASSFSRGVLDPTLIALVLFLAIRSASGIASLMESGVLTIYLSYPIPRSHIFIALLVSRVVIPSALILAVPLTTALVVLKFTMIDELDKIGLYYLAFVLQSLFYGVIFALFAFLMRRQTASGIASVSAYFLVITLNIILPTIGDVLENELLTELGLALSLPDILYRYVNGLEYELWQFTIIPLFAILAIITSFLYFTRRFEQ